MVSLPFSNMRSGQRTTIMRPVANAVLLDVEPFALSGTPASFLALSVTRHPTADDALSTVEFSGDLVTWHNDANHVVLISRTRTSANLVVEVWRAKEPISAGARQFLRLRVRSR